MMRLSFTSDNWIYKIYYYLNNERIFSIGSKYDPIPNDVCELAIECLEWWMKVILTVFLVGPVFAFLLIICPLDTLHGLIVSGSFSDDYVVFQFSHLLTLILVVAMSLSIPVIIQTQCDNVNYYGSSKRKCFIQIDWKNK